MSGIIGSIDAVPLVAGVSAVFAVAAMLMSLFAVWRTRAMVQAAEKRVQAAIESSAAGLRNCREGFDSLSVQVRDMPHESLQAVSSAVPKSSLNMGKRSQVLRMHRRGDAPEQIAIALEVPLQEVDLLLKVQRIVLRNL